MFFSFQDYSAFKFISKSCSIIIRKKNQVNKINKIACQIHFRFQEIENNKTIELKSTNQSIYRKLEIDLLYLIKAI